MTILEEKPLVSRGLVCLEQILEVISYKVFIDLHLRITVVELTAVEKQVSGAVFESKQDEWKSSISESRPTPKLPPLQRSASSHMGASESLRCSEPLAERTIKATKRKKPSGSKQREKKTKKNADVKPVTLMDLSQS
ncbi:hypothetical protein BLNAU_3496 [Blattamonas nauphoetae]|uniref:Uncharacterized protein n=1 Tax=Blattamonas nauphoetae TaxID=2049346 RepID=A0ABQ9YC87_9EUKA|nr:hypothetical protein BLNAU_3496 [Blattamonas nauphoetae]